MPTEFRLPQLTESMAKVKLSAWLKHEGDTVKQGEPIVEVETDKTNVELEAPENGVLRTIHVKAGTDAVAAGTLLATIGDGDEKAASAPATESAKTAKSAKAPETEAAESRSTPPNGGSAEAAAKSARAPEPSRPKTAAPPPLSPESPAPSEKILSTALAARMAKVAGIDLAAIPAAGRRVTKADVQAFLSAASGATEATGARGAQRAPVARETSVASFEDRPLTAMRRVTAARLQQAKQTIPHFYLETDCRADALLDVRKQINESSADLKVTLTDLLVLACAVALRRVPEANSEWIDGALRVHESVDIAVAVNTPQGLITPVIRGCQRKPLATISRELKELSERARGGRLKPEEYTNGTFTLSNLGMFGVTRITPIVNPPQSCILGIGAVESRPVVVDGGVVPGRVMGCTLAADHRAVDGALGAQLLQEIRRLIEQPLTMMIGV